MAFRDLILKIVPSRMAVAMEAESREWMMTCKTCGDERSVWDQGGMRYKARGEPTMGVRCPRCGRKRAHRVHRVRK